MAYAVPSHSDISDLLTRFSDQPFELLKSLGGYYVCPTPSEGRRAGPLVGYAKEYEPGKHYVGDIEVNFRVAEEHPRVVYHFARRFKRQAEFNRLLPKVDTFCGAPRGGESLADKLALHYSKRYLCADKRVIESAAGDQREKTELVFGRHRPMQGAQVALVEDVTNNFSTTEELVHLVARADAHVVALVTFFNRSQVMDGPDYYTLGEGTGRRLPVISLIRKPLPQYRQDDPAVADDVARGNVVWQPKKEWGRLMTCMTHHS